MSWRSIRRVPLPVLILVALSPLPAIAYLVSSTSLDSLTTEDHVVETAQAAAFLLAGVLFLARAARRRGRDAWALLLGVGLVVVGGEEISWGQRVFGVETPASLADSNVQGELNLHNIEGIHGNIRALGIVVIVSLFVLLPLAVARVAWVRSLVTRLRVPEVPLWTVPLALVALAYMVVPRVAGGYVFDLDEIGELYVALTALGFALAAAGWHASPAAEGSPAASAASALQVAR